MLKDSLGKDYNGEDVYLKDIWPSSEQIASVVGDNDVGDKIMLESCCLQHPSLTSMSPICTWDKPTIDIFSRRGCEVKTGQDVGR